ncbi:MAG: hypothetical protein IJ737_05455 [Ruminococcus sp.]|nr:hypothetical protein [Ruminococcus sp.]
MDPLAIVILVGVLAISLGIAIPYGLYLGKQQQNLTNSGQMLKREYDFYKKQNLFRSSVSGLEQLYSALDKGFLNSQGIACEHQRQNGCIAFANQKVGGTFRAEIEPLGYNQTIGAYIYRYQLTHWTNVRNRGFSTADRIGANILLTAVEKAFLTLDYNAVVERSYAEFKSKTSFF